jgi:hypothetical protein
MPVVSVIFIAAILGLMTYDVAVQPVSELVPTVEAQKVTEEVKPAEAVKAEPVKAQPAKKTAKKKKKVKKPVVQEKAKA